MAIQRVTIAGILGAAAAKIEAIFQAWRDAGATLVADNVDSFSSLDDDVVVSQYTGTSPVAEKVDWFCEQLRAHPTDLQIVYFCEWIDSWLMGDLLPGPNCVKGRRFQAACYRLEAAIAYAGRCGTQFHEQEWLAARLCEAEARCNVFSERTVIVVVREVFDASAGGDEISAASLRTPQWLADFRP